MATSGERQLIEVHIVLIFITLTVETTGGECDTDMASWEAAINELYQLYSACKNGESQRVSKLIKQLKKRNVKFKLTVGNGTTTIHLMCSHGNLGMVKLLVEMYGNAEAKDENLRTPLHLACQQGNIEIAQYLYHEQGCNLQCEDKDGMSPCELADFNNHKDIVKYFNAHGQSPNADLLNLFQGVSKLHLLYTAFKERDFNLAKERYFQLCGMSINFVLKSGNCFTTLHFMCELGCLDGVKSFIEMYGNAEARDEKGRTPLHVACANGHINVAEYLIYECGCNKEARDNSQSTPLFTACFSGETDMVKCLVSRFGCKFDVRDANGWSPLHVACGRGYMDIIEYLINQCGFDREARDNKLMLTPLFMACLTGQTNIVKCLVSKFSCKLDIRDNQERTPVHAACFNGCQELFQYLVNDCGCSLKVTDKEKEWIPLHLACAGGHLEMIKQLVNEYGCDIEARDIQQRTPLHVACGKGCIDTIEYLINQCGCDKEARDEHQRTPLYTACAEGQTDTVKYLVSHFQCKFDIRDINEHTPLHTACYFGFQELIQYLIKDCGCNPQITEETLQQTPLHIACAGGHIETIKQLVNEYGCDIEARDSKLHTPLHVACGNGCIDIIEYLINQCGCDKEARDEHQRTPLYTACAEGQTDTVKYLVSHFQCKVDIRDIEGRTPLHVACYYGFLELVQYFIKERGFSPEGTDGTHQRTSFHWACLGGHLETIKYLAGECKCNTEARDKDNATPLYLTSRIVPSSGPEIFTEVVPYLILEQGCDPEAETLDGSSPMKNFYRYGQLSIVKCCIKFKNHDPKTWRSHHRSSQSQNTRNVTNDVSDSSYRVQSGTYLSRSPLQVACARLGSMDVIKFLVEGYGFDPMEGVELVGADNKEEVLRLLESANVVLPFPDSIDAESIPAMVSQNYPLDQACYCNRLDMLQYLISKCGGTISSSHCERLMLTVCRYGHSEIMRYLLKYGTPDFEDSKGNTLLHIATTGKNLKGAYETVKVLIASMATIDQRNYLGETALHTACKKHPCHPDIVDVLLFSGCNFQVSNFAGKTPLWITQNSEVFKVFMKYSPADVCERILSDDIEEEQSLELFQCLVKQHNWNPDNKTENGDTALHLACRADRPTVVKYLFSIDAFIYDPHAKNHLNQTPIELTSSKEIIRELIEHGSNPIDLLINPVMDEEQVLELVKEMDEEMLNGITINDNTALHFACLTDRVTVVNYLLRKSKINVDAKNQHDFSPIQLTKNSEIIKELIRSGASPADLYTYCRRVLGESNLLQTMVKVFVLGDSNVGKSTLISSLKKEGWFSFFTSWSSTANPVTTDDTEPAHGIITHDFNSKYCGQMMLYDFVGTRLFHESQSDLLRQTTNSPRVFLVIVNLSGSDEEIISSLQFWLSFLEEMSTSDSEFKNHTVIVGSNMDKCREDEKRKTSIVKIFLQERVKAISNVDYHDFIALDCRSHSSSNVTKLRRCLAKLCIIARNPKSLAFNAHCFQVYLVERFKEKAAVSVREILNKIKGELKDVDENDPLNFLPQSDFQLQNLCIELHNKSQILYLRDSRVSEMDPERSWLVIDKAALISCLLEAFESKVFKQLPSNNGVMSFSTLSEFGPFKIYNSDMFVRFLCHLEYCREISDLETLQAITKSASAGLASRRCLFFPALVENSAPDGIWDDGFGSFSYHCGWILQCTKPEQFFSSKFLQMLILRVMFCNTYLGPYGASIIGLLNCSLWKGGISWGNVFGAESLVEVFPDNKTVLFLMRCRDTNLAKCIEHRSTIIHQIRKCAEEFCGKLKTRESLIFPMLVKKYPISSTPTKLLFDVKPLAFAAVNITSVEEPFASSLTGTNTIPIRDLLKFEPYFELSALIIQEICNINNPRYISCLTDDFLLHFTQQIQRNSIFIEIISQILNDYNIVDSNVDNLLSKLVEWRDTCHITYQQLHECIDRFSIFAGLSILVRS